MRQAPAEGFPNGPTCLGTRTLEVVSVNGPDRVAPQANVHYGMTLRNPGTATWPGTTKLRLASGTTSPLHDASWASSTVVATLGSAIAPMTSGTIDCDVMTPAATDEPPVFQELVLDDNGQKFGDIQLVLTVVPGGTTGEESGDGSEYGDDVQGGCSTGGGRAGALVLLGFVGIGLRRPPPADVVSQSGITTVKTDLFARPSRSPRRLDASSDVLS